MMRKSNMHLIEIAKKKKEKLQEKQSSESKILKNFQNCSKT